jgi:cellulose synthase/poly-beta-1,6-N-acetylglucosamine synthase-like glycosyltransferase
VRDDRTRSAGALKVVRATISGQAGPPLTGRAEHEYAFLLDGLVDRETLARADREAQITGVAPHQVLLARGWVGADRYVEALSAHVSGMRQAPARSAFSTVLLDGTAGRPAELGRLAAIERAAGHAVLLVSPAAAECTDLPVSRARRAEHAAGSFLQHFPDYSAGAPVWRWQVAAALAALVTTTGSLIAAPTATLEVLIALISLPFLFVVALRMLALIAGGSVRRARPVRRVPDAELPVYTILVPMLREADVLADFVRALRTLDYPPAKLDVILILESSDTGTRRAAEALDLPGYVRVAVVPDAAPQTKPRALNYGLQIARGQYVAVYDAEDMPEPDQLRRALAAFAGAGTELACVQAQLNTYNARASWLTRQFTLEYSALFDAILPALARIGLPLPLGGTSNHFPRQVLEEAGGWDPHNVTEDADLGIRIARRGGEIAVVGSTTWEEAPPTFAIWKRQRTRWLKGWMLTYLVHMRRPRRLLRELGLKRFLGFQVLMGGLILSTIVHPLFYLMLGLTLSQGTFMALPTSGLERVLLGVAAFNLAAGYLSAMALAALAVYRRRRFALAFDVCLMPLYWLLISYAAYRALWQVLRDPYLWEKTPHASRSRRGG